MNQLLVHVEPVGERVQECVLYNQWRLDRVDFVFDVAKQSLRGAANEIESKKKIAFKRNQKQK
jgi:hypothetical protein